MLIYQLLADIVILLHLLWVLFTLFGSLIAHRYPWLKRIHIGMLLYGFIIEIFGWVCPLTYLENWLREQYNPSTIYRGDFIMYYVGKLLYLEISRIWLIIGIVIVIIFNAWVYLKFSPNRQTG